MALKDLFRRLTGRNQPTEETALAAKPADVALAPTVDELFPVIPAASVDLTRRRKLPLEALATLGAAFATLPQVARTIATTIHAAVSITEPLFRQINPKNIAGMLEQNALGTTGGIRNYNAQGKSVYVGRMRYQQVSPPTLTGTSTTILPFDPMTLAIAATLLSISAQLDTLQQKAEDILQFLQADKQSRQRGNLATLNEIMADYKAEGGSEHFCTLRFPTVQAVKRDAFHDIDFYHRRVTALLQQKPPQKAAQVQELLTRIASELREYQLASYLYGYATLLETLLEQDLSSSKLQTAIERLQQCAARYDALYRQCHEHLGAAQRGSLQNRLLSGLGSLSRSMGETLSAVPVLNKVPMDEALIAAGQSLAQRNRDAAVELLEQFTPLEDAHIVPFSDALRTLNAVTNQPEGMLTDGEFLYLPQPD